MTDDRDQPLSSDEMLRRAREHETVASSPATDGHPTESEGDSDEPDVASEATAAPVGYAEGAEQRPAVPLVPVRSRWRKVGVGVAIAFAVVVGLAVVGSVVGDTDEAVATYNEGVEMSELGKWEDAIVSYTDVIESDTSNTDILAQAYGNRSRALSELGRFEEAIADATAVIELEPDNTTLAVAYVNRSRALSELGRLEEAIADATAAIELEPNNTESLAVAYLNRALDLAELGRVEEAIADYTAAIELEPNNTETLARAYVNRSFALGRLERFEEAIADATAVIERDPDDTDLLARAYVNRSFPFGSLERFEEAIADATAAIELEPDNTRTLALAYLLRAGALESLGQTDEAFADLQAIVGLLPPGNELRQLAVELTSDLLDGSSGTSLGGEYGEPVVTGDPLPFFVDTANDEAIDLAAPEVVGADFDGNTVSIKNNGRAKAITFVAHWCPHCQQEVPRITEWLANGGGVEGVDMYSVATSMNSARENFPSSEWLDAEEWPVPVIADDADGTVHLSYGAGGFPFWVFVDAAGNVVARSAGQLDIPTLESLMQLAADSGAQ